MWNNETLTFAINKTAIAHFNKKNRDLKKHSHEKTYGTFCVCSLLFFSFVIPNALDFSAYFPNWMGRDKFSAFRLFCNFQKIKFNEHKKQKQNTVQVLRFHLCATFRRDGYQQYHFYFCDFVWRDPSCGFSYEFSMLQNRFPIDRIAHEDGFIPFHCIFYRISHVELRSHVKSRLN